MHARKSIYRCLVFFSVLALFFIPLPDDTLWWRQAANSGHVIIFLLFSFVLYNYLGHLRQHQARLKTYAVIIIVGMLMGVVVELIQHFTGRELAAVDLLTNFFGLLAGLCLVEVYRQSEHLKGRPVRVLLVVSSLILILVSVMPLILLTISYIERNQAFPVIADFDAQWKSAFIAFNHSRLDEMDGRGQDGMHWVTFEPAEYPEISVIEPVPDWTDYDRLLVTLSSNYSHILRVTIRIHDAVHNQSYSDRYNMRLVVEPGVNAYEILLDDVEQAPSNRTMDMTSVAGLILFVNALDKPVTLGVSNIRLGKH